MNHLKRIAAKMPERAIFELKRLHYGRQINRKTFVTSEPEFEELDKYVFHADWAIDIGANIGHYTCKISDIVGPTGRVIAFEPIPTTFALLAANVNLLKYNNVTLINAAASDTTNTAGMSVPTHASGLDNFYMASISEDRSNTDLNILTLPVDNLGIREKVSFIKIDAEGHEPNVVNGLRNLIERDKPNIVIETVTDDIRAYLTKIGYLETKHAGSPNTVYCISAMSA